MSLSRELGRAARKFANAQSDRLAAIPSVRAVLVTVASTTGGLSVSWRGSTYLARGRGAAYTPAVGDRVLCLLVDDQLIVVDRIV